MNSSPVMFTQDTKSIVVCSSSFQSQQSQTAAPVEEITADQILDMPIVFADEPQEDVKPTINEDGSYYFTNSIPMVVKEELIDEKNEENNDDDDNVDVVCSSPMSRAAVQERLKIKQVCANTV